MGSGHRYLIALGSNVRHPRFGAPPQVLAAALQRLAASGVAVERSSRIHRSAPLGPSTRNYANGAAIVQSPLGPPDFLALLKRVEVAFGRRAGGQRWRSRVLDLDVILWSGGCWSGPGLTIPHPAFRDRRFVLRPATEIAPGWRDPITRQTLRHLDSRLTRMQPLA